MIRLEARCGIFGLMIMIITSVMAIVLLIFTLN
jgi:hypothetical protein